MNEQDITKFMTTAHKSGLDLSTAGDGGYISEVLKEYSLKAILSDIIMVKYTDESESGREIMRGGIYVPLAQVRNAWRVGHVLMTGPNVKQTKVGDYVIFPDNVGVPVANMKVNSEDTGKCIFLNEERIFGIADKI